MNIFTLENDYLKVNFSDIGGVIIDLIKKSNQINYVLHYDDLKRYEKNIYFLGAVIGRNAGRTYPSYYSNYLNRKIKLDTNEGDKHLHGGDNGLHRKRFEVVKKNSSECSLFLKDDSSLYDSAYIEINYRLDKNKLIYTLTGRAEVPTIFNLTNHTYFNLNKDKGENISQHWLQINSEEIQLINDDYIPNGKIEKLGDGENQEYFFLKSKLINKIFLQNTHLSEICNNGIDLAYLFNKGNTMTDMKIHLKSFDKENQLKIYSNQNACVVYTLNKIEEIVKINNGNKIKKHNGITFEMQEIPNYVHILPNYLKQKYESITIYEVI